MDNMDFNIGNRVLYNMAGHEPWNGNEGTVTGTHNGSSTVEVLFDKTIGDGGVVSKRQWGCHFGALKITTTPKQYLLKHTLQSNYRK